MNKPKCLMCSDTGWLLASFDDNSRAEIMRCDSCKKFPGDLEAAAACCANGKFHLGRIMLVPVEESQ